MLLEPRRAHTQQKHNCEHCGTLNSEIPEIPPIKKNTHHFPHYSFSSLQTAAPKWWWFVWEFMGGNKNYFEIKRLAARRCNSAEKEPLNKSFLHLPADFRPFSWLSFSSFPKNLRLIRLQGTCRKHFSDGWERIFPCTLESLVSEVWLHCQIS